MDKRRSVAILTVLGALPLLAATLASLEGGCSNDGSGSADDDAGAGEAGPARSPPSEQGASPAGDCRAACESAHATAVGGDRAINACWRASCAGPCLAPDAGSGDEGDDGGAGANTDGGAEGTDGGTCGQPVVTGSAACDRCTTARCCAAWDGCFADPECESLETCYQSCP